MINLWHNFIAGECMVIEINDHLIFPIFKNGYSSLHQTTGRRIILNDDIRNLEGPIDVIIRDPEWRFVSGFNQYMFDSKYTERSDDWSHTMVKAYDDIRNNKLTDAHFIPQFVWLMQLSKYYNKQVRFKGVEHLANITTLRKNREMWHSQQQKDAFVKVEPLDHYVEVDKNLMKYIDQTINLTELIRKYKNVLP